MKNTEVELRQLFQNIDRNRDGRLEKSELQQAFRHAGLTVSNRKLDSFFEQVDTNNDGSVSFEEWRYVILLAFFSTPTSVGTWLCTLRKSRWHPTHRAFSFESPSNATSASTSFSSVLFAHTLTFAVHALDLTPLTTATLEISSFSSLPHPTSSPYSPTTPPQCAFHQKVTCSSVTTLFRV